MYYVDLRKIMYSWLIGSGGCFIFETKNSIIIKFIHEDIFLYARPTICPQQNKIFLFHIFIHELVENYCFIDGVI